MTITDTGSLQFLRLMGRRMEALLFKHDARALLGVKRRLRGSRHDFDTMATPARTHFLFTLSAFYLYTRRHGADMELGEVDWLLTEYYNGIGQGRRVARNQRLLVSLVARGIIRRREHIEPRDAG